MSEDFTMEGLTMQRWLTGAVMTVGILMLVGVFVVAPISGDGSEDPKQNSNSPAPEVDPRETWCKDNIDRCVLDIDPRLENSEDELVALDGELAALTSELDELVKHTLGTRRVAPNGAPLARTVEDLQRTVVDLQRTVDDQQKTIDDLNGTLGDLEWNAQYIWRCLQGRSCRTGLNWWGSGGGRLW